MENNKMQVIDKIHSLLYDFETAELQAIYVSLWKLIEEDLYNDRDRKTKNGDPIHDR